jgi:hypothetical protein
MIRVWVLSQWSSAGWGTRESCSCLVREVGSIRTRGAQIIKPQFKIKGLTSPWKIVCAGQYLKVEESAVWCLVGTATKNAPITHAWELLLSSTSHPLRLLNEVTHMQDGSPTVTSLTFTQIFSGNTFTDTARSVLCPFSRCLSMQSSLQPRIPSQLSFILGFVYRKGGVILSENKVKAYVLSLAIGNLGLVLLFCYNLTTIWQLCSD